VKTLAVFLFAAALSAQTVKPALPVAKPETKAIYPEDVWYMNSGTMVITRYATATEKVTSDGHYIFTVDDPNNEYRCYGTVNDDTLTIVCVKAHEVVKDKSVAK
jgi:hypothetical protein